MWIALIVELPFVAVEPVANFLVECGSPGVAIDERGDRGTLTGYFSSSAPIAAVRQYCQDLDLHILSINTTRLDDQDWAENWKLHSTPLEIGRRLYISPSWAWAPRPEHIAIQIDPGMAFGTGQHATTSGCLELIELEMTDRRVARALDLGTGSGILAIAMAKLGAVDVTAVDNDVLACSIARRNIENNGCTSAVRVSASFDAAGDNFDLIVANLFADILVDLSGALADRSSPSGRVVLSGFLRDDAPRVLSAYATHGLIPHRVQAAEDWTTVALSRGKG